MWIESSEDQTAPIYCQSCKGMIEEEMYAAHWRTCNSKTIPKPSAPISQPSPSQTQKVEVRDQEATFPCPKCSQDIPIQAIQDHEMVCQDMQVECSYCSTLVPADEIDSHEGSCESNPNQNTGSLDLSQLLALMSLMNNQNEGNNGNGNGGGLDLASLLRNRNRNANNGNGNNGNNGNGNSNANASLMASLLANRGMLGGNQQSDATEDLLHNSLFPALKNMDKGIKKRELDQLPTEKYKKDIHIESQCPICMEEFEQGEAIMKVSCSHIFHDHCYKDWLRHNNTCPLCKTVIKISKPPKEQTKQ